jgi:lon-related putative ATP-dependent protease
LNKKTQLSPLPAESLYRACNPDDFDFQTTDELADIDLVVGQERAIDALQFGINIKDGGYNIYALGPAGTGKHKTVHQIITRIATDQQPAPDWCYVNNFSEPHKPIALRLPAGYGSKLRDSMEQLVEELSISIPAAFESDEYHSRLDEIEEELKEKHSTALNELREEALKHGIMLIKTPTGFAFAPMNDKEEVLSPEDFDRLPDDKQNQITQKTTKLQEHLKKILDQLPAIRKETTAKIRALDNEIGKSTINHLIDTIKNEFRTLPEVCKFLDEVEKDILKNISSLRSTGEEGPMAMFGISSTSRNETFLHYLVNLLVDNSKLETAPVISENLPTHSNLIGRCEYQSHMGTLVTDFSLIKAGALHKANGGYLILDARKILMQPFAWESLKRCLEAGEIRVESLERTLSLISTVSLEPQPIPVNLKVVLVGDPMLYYLMNYYDPDFQDLFKVAADFDNQMDRDIDNTQLYASMIATLARQHKLRPLQKAAVIRLIEHSARLVSDTEKLTTHIRSISDLLCESDHWAGQSGHETISKKNVQQAIDKQIYRSNRIQQRIIEEIKRGTILISTSGDAVGQVNGLSVMQLGDFTFGQPSRITATMRIGEGKVLDIERETELGGAIHSKGVLILSGYLRARYVKDSPLSMSASIVFEQSYGGVEGDSASLAELCALLSAIANVPIRQSFAMTGSINQHGQVQPIGGVNEKIEGFFDVCKAYGSTGEQGVLIPESNVKHLMLREDIVQAVSDGQFFIYAVSNVDEALELLTGLEAGERDKEGNFPEQSVNAKVEQQLLEFSQIRQKFAHEHNKEKEQDKDE